MKACYFMSCFFHVEFVRFLVKFFCGISLWHTFWLTGMGSLKCHVVVQCRMVLYADTWYTACKTQLETLRLFRGLMLCGKTHCLGWKLCVCIALFVLLQRVIILASGAEDDEMVIEPFLDSENHVVTISEENVLRLQRALWKCKTQCTCPVCIQIPYCDALCCSGWLLVAAHPFLAEAAWKIWTA